MQMKEMMQNFPFAGKVEWIGLRPAKRASLQQVESAEITTESGLLDDHYSGSSGNRQVTLIQQEHIQSVAHFMQKDSIDPGLLRRNIVVSGINLLGLKEQKLQIGEEVILEVTGLCHPCSRMEENLGEGGYNAMRGHGGMTTKVVQGGRIKVGDLVRHYSEVVV